MPEFVEFGLPDHSFSVIEATDLPGEVGQNLKDRFWRSHLSFLDRFFRWPNKWSKFDGLAIVVQHSVSFGETLLTTKPSVVILGAEDLGPHRGVHYHLGYLYVKCIYLLDNVREDNTLWQSHFANFFLGAIYGEWINVLASVELDGINIYRDAGRNVFGHAINSKL